MGNQSKILKLIKQDAPLNPIAYVQDIVRDMAVDTLQYVMSEYKEEGEKPYRTLFHGNPRADLLIINDRPYIEGSIYSLQDTSEGELLHKVLDHFGYDKSNVAYIDAINFIPYRRVGNDLIERLPSKQEMISCKAFTDYAIDIVRPKAILLLGPIASSMYHNQSFNEVAHQVIQTQGFLSVATYSPHRLLNVDQLLTEDALALEKDEFVTDIEELLKQINH